MQEIDALVHAIGYYRDENVAHPEHSSNTPEAHAAGALADALLAMPAEPAIRSMSSGDGATVAVFDPDSSRCAWVVIDDDGPRICEVRDFLAEWMDDQAKEKGWDAEKAPEIPTAWDLWRQQRESAKGDLMPPEPTPRQIERQEQEKQECAFYRLLAGLDPLGVD